MGWQYEQSAQPADHLHHLFLHVAKLCRIESLLKLISLSLANHQALGIGTDPEHGTSDPSQPAKFHAVHNCTTRLPSGRLQQLTAPASPHVTPSQPRQAAGQKALRVAPPEWACHWRL